MVEPTPVETIDLNGVKVWVKREDQNHPIVQGNKLHKLKYNILAAQQQKAKTLVTFGGAYSNHLVATAYAAKQVGLSSLALVRGDELAQQPEQWSNTLHQCQQYGMQLHFVSRSEYRLKQDSQTAQNILADIKAAYIIPEGGSNVAAIHGVAELITEIDSQLPTPPSHVFCPVGTGGTLAGIIAGCAQSQWHCQVLGISVLKGLQGVKYDINQWLSQYGECLDGFSEWHMNHHYHGGGYARLTPEMIQFGQEFRLTHGFVLDKIYNVKSFFALNTLIKKGLITPHDRPLIIHTGGLQGGVL